MKRTYFAAAAVALVCLAGCSAEPEITPEESLPEPGIPMLEQQLLSCTVEAAFEMPEAKEAAPEAESAYTDEDLEILALLIYQEAGGDACSDDTRLKVGTVALNRVADARFPDTLLEVATQKRQYGRLYWTGLVWPERADKPEEAHAVERAYESARAVLEGERAGLPEDVVFQAEFEQGTETVAYQDGLYFCR